MMKFLILPGFGNSGPDHWQSLWEKSELASSRIQQDDWEAPDCAAWLSRLEAAVQACGPDTVLVAHSLSCLLVAYWAAVTKLEVRAALLVAVPEPGCPMFPPQARGFSTPPQNKLPFKSMVVASTDDPYGSVDYARQCATAWGSELVNIGNAGHINSSSGLGDWPAGRKLLQRLVDGAVKTTGMPNEAT
jgi:predicted alpha/beta hydrolase family esterase